VCRPSAGICDPSPEHCTGSNASCPANVLASSSTVCRPSAGDCDVTENCTGSAASCPANSFKPNATPCGDPADTSCDNPDSCNSSGTCLTHNENNGTPCDDDAFCNGSDTCASGTCTSHAGDPCPGVDGDADCSETCDETADACTGNDPNGSACNDADICTVGETCTAGTCGGGAADDCDDDNLCTTDSCDAVDGCVNDAVPIVTGCFVAAKAKFSMKDNADDTKDGLKWGWQKGQSYPATELGTPGSTTTYALCVYDADGGAPSLVASMQIPPGTPPWTTKPTSVKYVDKSAASDGVSQAQVKAGDTDGKSSAKLKAAGIPLDLPAPVDAEHFLHANSLVVELVNSAGACWTSEFAPDGVKKNTTTQFKASAP
jgi:hypothetical protein